MSQYFEYFYIGAFALAMLPLLIGELRNNTLSNAANLTLLVVGCIANA